MEPSRKTKQAEQAVRELHASEATPYSALKTVHDRRRRPAQTGSTVPVAAPMRFSVTWVSGRIEPGRSHVTTPATAGAA